MNIAESVSNFILQRPRNQLILTTSELSGFQYANVNKEFGKLLLPILNDKDMSLKAKDLLIEFIKKNRAGSDELGEYVAMKEIGILIENELKIDISSFLNTNSLNQTLILHWEGEIIDNKLYFLTKQHGLEIDISSLSHIVL